MTLWLSAMKPAGSWQSGHHASGQSVALISRRPAAGRSDIKPRATAESVYAITLNQKQMFFSDADKWLLATPPLSNFLASLVPVPSQTASSDTWTHITHVPSCTGGCVLNTAPRGDPCVVIAPDRAAYRTPSFMNTGVLRPSDTTAAMEYSNVEKQYVEKIQL